MKSTKIEHQLNQILPTSLIDIGNLKSYRHLAILSKFKSGTEIIAFSRLISKYYGISKYFDDVSKIENCDAP